MSVYGEQEALAFHDWFKRHNAQSSFLIVNANLDCAAQHLSQLPDCEERGVALTFLNKLINYINTMEQKSK